MLLIQSILDNYRQRNFTKDWLQDWKLYRSPGTWRAFAFPFAAALGACRLNAAERSTVWPYSALSPQAGEPLTITWGTSQSWQTSSLCAHHTYAGQCAQLEGSLHWEKTRQVCEQGTKKWCLQCSAFVCHTRGTHQEGNRSWTGCTGRAEKPKYDLSKGKWLD